MTEKPALPIEEINWLDHSTLGTTSWSTMEEAVALQPIAIRSVGFVVADTDVRIVIAAHLTAEDGVDGEMCILKSDIVTRKVLA